jgi:hypothetical protein
MNVTIAIGVAFGKRSLSQSFIQIVSNASDSSSAPRRIASSLQKGVRFLLDARDSDGFWRDFRTLAGPSDEWVTGYIGSILARFGGREGMETARASFRALLKSRMILAGWGYNRRVPPDADSTAWALALAQEICPPVRSLRLLRAARFLEKHIVRSGGVATYGRSLPIRAFTRLNRRVSFRGWCMPHVCVSAACASVAATRQALILDFIRESQEPDGSWRSYWWSEHEYATAFAMEALSRTGDVADRACCERGAAWIEARKGQQAAFAQALGLRALLAAGRRDSPRVPELLDQLLLSQRNDGSWESSAHLRIPPPDVVDPDSYPAWREGTGGGGSVQTDVRRSFTTATVVCALGHAIDKSLAS